MSVETFFPLFPIIFPHYFFNVPLNTRAATSSQVVLGEKKEREKKREGRIIFLRRQCRESFSHKCIYMFIYHVLFTYHTYLLFSLISRTIVSSLMAHYIPHCIKIGLKSESKGSIFVYFYFIYNNLKCKMEQLILILNEL